MISREKLKHLSKEKLAQKERVEAEGSWHVLNRLVGGVIDSRLLCQDKAEKTRQMVGVPDMDTVLSQARNGRLKRLEESLNLGIKP